MIWPRIRLGAFGISTDAESVGQGCQSGRNRKAALLPTSCNGYKFPHYRRLSVLLRGSGLGWKCGMPRRVLPQKGATIRSISRDVLRLECALAHSSGHLRHETRWSFSYPGYESFQSWVPA